jgi:hypothetical protein
MYSNSPFSGFKVTLLDKIILAAIPLAILGIGIAIGVWLAS